MRRKLLKLIIVAIVLLSLILVFYFINPNVYPWRRGGKLPSEYTWEEFMALDELKQEAFFEWFASADEFERWMSEEKPEEINVSRIYPWENGNKKPSEYTWEEFMALDEFEQEAFFEWFSSVEKFENWRIIAAPDEHNEDKIHVWEDGNKKPSEYTWEEFMALDELEQEAFFEWFDSPDAFEEWLKANQP